MAGLLKKKVKIAMPKLQLFNNAASLKVMKEYQTVSQTSQRG